MGFAQWFWRLFLVLAGIVVAHAVVVSFLCSLPGPIAERQFGIGIAAAIAIAAGAGAIWYCLRQITDPLAQLSRSVQEAAGSPGEGQTVDFPTEVGALAGAFAKMRQNLARRLEEIQENSQRLETILATMDEGVLAVGPDKTILLANEAGRRLLDFVTAEPIGRSLLEVTRARPVHEAVVRALQERSPVITEFDAPGIVRRTLSLRATRLPGSPCPGVMIVLHDLSELRRLENLRRELVANVSHELKTPLAAIKAYAETLRLGAVNDTEHNLVFVKRIEEQADRLHQLILDILQIARIEQGQETFEINPVELRPLIEQTAQQFLGLATSKEIALRTEPPPNGAAALADEEGLRTILNNLVDNAVKYTPSGGQVTIRGIASDRQVIVEVQDTGIGIAEKDQARIFERFYRADKARSREVGGTGLGLSIVKHLAQSFGGSVSLQSVTGQGSTFRVELPRAE